MARFPWIPPDSRQDLEQQACQVILTKAATAWKKGVPASNRILLAEARRKLGRFLQRESQEPQSLPDPGAVPDLASYPQKPTRLVELMDSLTDVETLALKLKYGLEGGGAHSHKEISESLAIPQTKVAQIIKGAITKMAAIAPGEGDSSPSSEEDKCIA